MYHCSNCKIRLIPEKDGRSVATMKDLQGLKNQYEKLGEEIKALEKPVLDINKFTIKIDKNKVLLEYGIWSILSINKETGKIYLYPGIKKDLGFELNDVGEVVIDE